MTMTTYQIQLARHALGLDGLRKTSYRNRFMASPDQPNHRAWENMVRDGNAQRAVSKQAVYYLTLAGARAALREGEHLDREDFPEIAT